MTRNRNADLQRKLGMASVAPPPDGLADRIKSEIPHDLRFQPERERTHLRQSVSSNLKIAASIILLVSSLYFALHLFTRSGLNTGVMATKERASAPVTRQVNVALPNVPPQPGSIGVPQPADLPSLPSAPPGGGTSSQPKQFMAEKKREESAGMTAGAPAYVDTVEAPRAPAAESIVVSKAEPQPVPVGEIGSFAPERANRDAATARAAAAPQVTFVAGAPPLPPPVAAPLEASLQSSDAAPARDFLAIEESIARGEMPRKADLAAIVRHFSAPEHVPADVHVELEASAAPLDASKSLLRVSVDAPASKGGEITLTFGEAIVAHRALTDAPSPNETALYEIEFKRSATPDQTIAIVQVGGITRTIRASELRSWNSASPRMKRASLAAAWTGTLLSRKRADAVVARAREAHIDDLADMAERVERNR